MNERNTAIDVAKALGILLMVLGHCPLPIWTRDFIFSFHMPLFLIFSGYFYKKRTTSQVVKKGLQQLIRPYFYITLLRIFMCLLALDWHGALQMAVAMILGSGSGHIFGYSVPIVGPTWFLLALFWCKLFYHYLEKKPRHIFLVCTVISTISFFFGKHITTLPLGILYGSCSLVFYSMGHYWKKHNIRHNLYQIFIGLLIWALCIWKGHFEMADYSCSLYPISMMGAYFGTYTTYICAARTPLQKIPFMKWLGSHTLLILCYHTLYFSIFSVINVYIFNPLCIEFNNWTKLVICVMTSLGLPILHISVKNKIQRNNIKATSL